MDKYRPGDYHVICQRCGETKYRSETRFTWDNLLVCIDSCWEPKHPQLSVKAKADKIRVADPRPDSQEISRSTTLSSTASKNDRIIYLSSNSNIKIYNAIGITLDEDPISGSNIVHWTFIMPRFLLKEDGFYLLLESGGRIIIDEIFLETALPRDAASGNTVYVTGSDYYRESLEEI